MGLNLDFPRKAEVPNAQAGSTEPPALVGHLISYLAEGLCRNSPLLISPSASCLFSTCSTGHFAKQILGMESILLTISPSCNWGHKTAVRARRCL